MGGRHVSRGRSRDPRCPNREALGAHSSPRSSEGPYRHAGKWARAMETYVTGKGQTVKKLYFYYATCPTCAKHYGKNHAVLFAKVQ